MKETPLSQTFAFASTAVILAATVLNAHQNEAADIAVVHLIVSAPVNVACRDQGGNPGLGDCYELYADSLADVPLVVRLSLGARQKEKGDATPIHTSTRSWHEFLRVHVDDGHSSAMQLKIIPGSERIASLEYREQENRWSPDIPAALQPGNGVSLFAEIRNADGTQLAPGIYQFTSKSASGAREFFGAEISIRCGFTITIKDEDSADENTRLENLIQRYTLWGRTLQLHDMPESEKVLEEGLALVQAYLRKGGGDEEGIYNVTPRYQAAMLLMWLDRNKEAVSYLQRAYIDGVQAPACRWQPYHFFPGPGGTLVGPLPNHAKDTIYRLLQRLYVRAYGRRLDAIPPDVEIGNE